MTKIVMKFIIFIVFQYNYQNISKSFKFPRNTPIFIQFPGEFPSGNLSRNSPDFQKMGKKFPQLENELLMALYNILTAKLARPLFYNFMEIFYNTVSVFKPFIEKMSKKCWKIII